MRILVRYISRKIFGTILTVLFSLVAIFSFFAFIGEIEDVGSGRYDLVSAVYVVILEIPKLMCDLMPFATLIGAMVALGSLAELNEIIAIRAAGGSKLNFLGAALKSAAVLAFCTITVGELVVPFSEEKANRIKLVLKKDADLTVTDEGFWAREGNIFINMQAMVGEGTFSDVTIYEFDDSDQLVKIVAAAIARFETGAWYLEEVSETLFDKDKVSAQIKERAFWPSNLDPKVVEMVALKPTTYTLISLYRYWQFAKKNGQRADHLERALWMKLALPLSIFAMVIISLCLVMGSQRSVSPSRRVLSAGSMGLAYHVACELLEQASAVYSLPASVSVLILPVLLLVVAFVWHDRVT